MPVLYVVACGGRPAADLPAFVATAQADGWTVCVVATPDGLKFLDEPTLRAQTGFPVRSQYKRPDEPDVLPPADAFVVAPATFNTVNKLAAGISDTLALGLLNEGIGLRRPVIVVPTPNIGLSRHPAFVAGVRTLREWGVIVLFDPASVPPLDSDPTTPAPPFPWPAATAALRELPR
ncbi:flavoprotein [Dactylosporangium sp. NPDC005555]|uniref:flavoprotein n=1 Tax=Dactylosporangium sp. NPDC005555 TaxID=3154889 RepID=UPI0033BB1AAE